MKRGGKVLKKRWFREGVVVLVFLLSFQTNAEGTILLPSLDISEEWNDNFFFSETDRRPEWTTTISPKFLFEHKGRFLNILVRYMGGVELHTHYTDKNSYRQTTDLGLDFPFLSHASRRFSIRLTEKADLTPTLPTIVLGSREATAGRISSSAGRIDTFRNLLGLTLEYDWSPRTSLTLPYLNNIIHYDAQDVRLEDVMIHDGGMEIRYRWTPKQPGLHQVIW